jgi:high-affinity iron transporter
MLRRILLCLTALFVALPASASAQSNDVETAWRLLDYVAVDYAGAVQDGKVVSASEYAEMREFSASVAEKIGALPNKPSKPTLAGEASRISSLIERKAPTQEVASAARALGAQLLAAYPVPLGPRLPPDLSRGAQLFQQNCASCHGANGDAKTAIAKQLDPPPIAFSDRTRASERSPFALYQVINQGLEGTAMQSFAQLPDADKWALAFEASRFAYPEKLKREGKRIWDSDPAVRSKIADLNALSSLSENELAKQIGADKAGAVDTIYKALDSPDYLVRKKAFELLDDPKLLVEYPGAANVARDARTRNRDKVLPYDAKTGTKLGQMLSTDADYRRALSRRNGRVKAVLTTQK